MGLTDGVIGGRPVSSYSTGAPLALKASGSGTISSHRDGEWLEIGKQYSVVAKPSPGQVFVNWTDGAGVLVTNDKVCNFTMVSNLVLRASFIPDPFIPLKGCYRGLFYPSASVDVSNSGFFQATLTGKRSFSGALLYEGERVGFSGVLDVSLQAKVSIAHPNKAAMQLQLQVTNDVIVGSVSTAFGWAIWTKR